MNAVWQLVNKSSWSTRVIMWFGTCLAGLTIVVFAKLSEICQSHMVSIFSTYRYAPLWICPLVAFIIIKLTQQFADGSSGSGIPQVIAAIRSDSIGKIPSFISLRIAFWKIILTCLGLFGGFAIGREGPSVQIAASINYYFYRFLPDKRLMRRPDVILAGGSAGIAAAFNAPLAGIVFAIEELGKSIESRVSSLLVSCIIFSGLVGIAINGNYNYFGRFYISNIDEKFYFLVIFSAIICGLLGGCFSKVLLLPIQNNQHYLWKLRSKYPALFAAVCGGIVAIIGILSHGKSFGNGYELTNYFIQSGANDSWLILLCRYLATIVSYLSGIPGGIFAPSLAIGSAIGALISSVAGDAHHLAPLIAICMAGFLSAVTQAPLTSAIIVMEMIDGHEMLIGLLIATFIAKGVSRIFSKELYLTIANALLKVAH